MKETKEAKSTKEQKVIKVAKEAKATKETKKTSEDKTFVKIFGMRSYSSSLAVIGRAVEDKGTHVRLLTARQIYY